MRPQLSLPYVLAGGCAAGQGQARPSALAMKQRSDAEPRETRSITAHRVFGKETQRREPDGLLLCCQFFKASKIGQRPTRYEPCDGSRGGCAARVAKILS